jgi:hypothetical protein
MPVPYINIIRVGKDGKNMINRKIGWLIALLVGSIVILTIIPALSSGTNLALNKTVTTSSNNTSSFDGPKAVDGDLATYWCASGGSFPQWLKVDLGSSSALGTIKQTFYDNDNTTFYYKFEGSNDDTNYTVLADRTASGLLGQTFTETVSGSYRYVRMTVTNATNLHWASSKEFEVYGPGVTPTPTPSPTPGSLTNFFNQSYTGSRNSFTGNVGYEFTPSQNITVTALGRSVSGSMNSNHDVKIWKVLDQSVVASVTITPSSSADGLGYKYQMLGTPVTLNSGVAYRITSYETSGGDVWMDIGSISNHRSIATVNVGVYSTSTGYPSGTYGSSEQGYVPPAFYTGSGATATPTPTPAATPTPTPVSGGATNFFNQGYTGSRNNHTGYVGFEFTPSSSIVVTGLGRAVSGSMTGSHAVKIWKVSDASLVASVTVTTGSATDAYGYKNEPLGASVSLYAGTAYRIGSYETSGGDSWMDLGSVSNHKTVATISSGIFSVGDTYPSNTYGGSEQGYVPSTFYYIPGASPSPSPTPVPRMVNVGYLLNCNFWTLHTYISPGDKKLSGWETDTSGGSWDASMQGNGYPAFDWFKLIDTSSSAGVTIKKRLANSTAGKITLEYRFRMPSKMDGVTWQLRSGNTAVVNVLTSGGNLCYENSGGNPVVLLNYNANQEYGVRVIADISARTADFYVDGVLKASGTAFRNAVSNIDYIYIKTGDAATGDLFLWPVEIHKGYLACEKFITTAVGSVPGDWTVGNSGGTCGVQEFDCAAKPDVYSVKMDDTSASANVTFSKSFTATGGKVVFDYKFLLPAKVDGMAAELCSGSTTGFKIVTSGGNLCYVNSGGSSISIQSYLANLWYTMKIKADVTTDTADIYVNGKLKCTGVSFNNVVSSFDSIRFSTSTTNTGVKWVDDVRVYPYQDYPADYVPQPVACPAVSPYILGMQSCSLWKEGQGYGGWDWIYQYSAQRKPYLGFYDEGSPEVADWEIKWMVEHGITYELYCWYRPDIGTDHPIKDTPYSYSIHDGFFNAKYSDQKKFVIMWEDNLFGHSNMSDFQNNLVPYWMEYFFKDPRYLKINNMPVISIYTYGSMIDNFGSKAGAKQALDYLRQQCVNAGFAGAIVLMEYRSSNPADMQNMKDIGVDDIYAYTWGTSDINSQKNANIAQRDNANGIIDMLPMMSVGWNTQAWGGSAGSWATTADYKTLAQWMKDTFMPSLPAGKLGQKMLMLANWNEFGEGQFLMPSNLGGFGYLDGLRDVFTTGGAHADDSPTINQKSRFTVLFSRDW